MFIQKGLLRTYSSIFLYLYRLLDLSLVIFAGFLSYFLITQGWPEGNLHKSLLILSVFVFTTISAKLRLYAPWRGRHFSDELAIIIISSVLLIFAVFAVGIILDIQFVNSNNISWISVWGLLLIVSQSSVRLALRTFLKVIRRFGYNQRRLLLVGSNSTGQTVLDEIVSHPEYGLQVVGYIDDRAAPREPVLKDLDYLGNSAQLSGVIRDKKIDQVWITYPFKGEDRARKIIDGLRYETTSTRLVLDMNMIKDSDKSLTELAGIPLLDIDVSPMDGVVSRIVKTVEDKVFSFFILLLFSPLMLILAIGVKLSSPGPIFYRQVRLSWNNEPFGMLKFRSMPVDAESKSGPKWASSGEQRATRFGAFLRKTSLDELPQFINVLKGDMSIVGPRPERPEFVEEFKEKIPNYMKKHMVKAGITGWAQINGLRGDTDLKARIDHDMYYIKNWSPIFDLEIALLTIIRGFINKNAY